MVGSVSDRPQPWLRPWMVLVAVALLCGVLAELRPDSWIFPDRPVAPAVAPAAFATAGASVASGAAAAPQITEHAEKQPSFDVVRADPHGALVVAGRAPAGAEVTLKADGKTLASGTADATGQFVLLPDGKLPSGPQTLTLSSRLPGQAAMSGSAPVLLDLPAQGTPPLAVALPGGGAMPRVLQDGAKPVTGRLALSVVDYNSKGAVHFAGQAPRGATVRLYVDSQAVGDARSAGDGAWELTPDVPIGGGPHTLRVDQLDPSGRVLARIELPFVRETVAPGTLTPGRIVVQPGQSLWRLARASYGQGVQYVVIYRANRDQIANPDLIYPGQAFTIPDELRPEQ